MVSVRTPAWVRGTGLALLTLAALRRGGAAARAASVGARQRTVEALDRTVPNSLPRVFVHGRAVRIYYGEAQPYTVFKSEWHRPELEGRDFVAVTAELRHDATPPRLPAPGGTWVEAAVLSPAQVSEVAADVAELMVPRDAEEGIYFRTASREGVLYRDTNAVVHLARVGEQPDSVKVTRHLTPQEVAGQVRRLARDSLEALGPGRQWFFLTLPEEGGRTHFLLLNLEAALGVFLLAPPVADDSRGGPRLGSTTASVGSMVFESHGYAIVKNPASSLARLLSLGLQSAASLFSPRLRLGAGPPPPAATGGGMDLKEWERWLDDWTDSRSEPGSARLLIDGAAFFPRFEERIEEARKSVHLEVCIFDRDDVAVTIADRLRRRSREIEVQVLLDRMSSQASGEAPPGTPMPEGFQMPSSITTYLRQGSRVKVRAFLNTWLSADHAKVFVIDGRYAYLGGMNLGREYRYEWHDLMVEVEGPIVAAFERDFDKRWAHAGPLGDLAFAERSLFSARPRIPAFVDPPWIPLRRLYTRTGRPYIRSAVLEALRRAQGYIFLENGYLTDNTVILELARARRRGVDVRVILPSENDQAGGQQSMRVTANYLLSNGVRVFLYPGMTHVKALLVDGWACVGSANFNALSLRNNQETNLATSDPAFAASLRQELFEADFRAASELDQSLESDWWDYVADSLLGQF